MPWTTPPTAEPIAAVAPNVIGSAICPLDSKVDQASLWRIELSTQPLQPALGRFVSFFTIADDLIVTLQRLLHLNLRATDEHELVLHRVRSPHPEVGLIREETWRDQAPTADELTVDEAGVDLAKGLAVVEQVELPTIYSIEV